MIEMIIYYLLFIIYYLLFIEVLVQFQKERGQNQE
jgi:hypothetical protein